MFAMQYSHRLPAEHDLDAIRQRAAAKGPQWDAWPGLACKAFVLQEKGRHGAEGNLYASVYLWHEAAAATAFLAGEAFQGVIDSFGRPAVVKSRSSALTIMSPNEARFAMCDARSPRQVDFACGFQAGLSNGTRSSSDRVVVIS